MLKYKEMLEHKFAVKMRAYEYNRKSMSSPVNMVSTKVAMHYDFCDFITAFTKKYMDSGKFLQDLQSLDHT